ncbi:hypothetical protein EniLVp02_0082 [Vibrio phage EniLVp02]
MADFIDSKVTRREAIKMFEEMTLTGDVRPANLSAQWRDYMEDLAENGLITERQFQVWKNPYDSTNA